MADKVEWAVRRFCLECQGGNSSAVAACADFACLLFDCRLYRPGHKGQSCQPDQPDQPDQPEQPEQAVLPHQSGLPGQSGHEDPPLQPCPDTARAVRRFCLACAGNRREVRDCDAKKNCALWSFRFGVSPATFKRVLSRRRKKRGRLTLPGL